MKPLQVTGAAGLGRAAEVLPTYPAPTSPAGSGALPVRLRPLQGADSREIARLAALVSAVFVMDRSGSMYGSWGDPSDICGAAVESLIDLQRRSGGGRATVVPWGSQAPAELVSGPYDVRSGAKQLSRALRVHSSLGGNDLPAALRRAKERMPVFAPSEVPILFVITDGIEDVTPAMHAAVAALPRGSVHMCLIDRSGGCSDAMESAWRTVAFGSFTRLTHLDVAAMANQLATIYADALGLTSTPARPRTRPAWATALIRRNS